MTLTLTTLLTSLHSHLNSQSQILPEIHNQLGLSPSALQDDLATLQESLINTIDATVAARRNELDVWLEKCDAVDKECAQYARALAGNAKATGDSLADLRREKVLPVRYNAFSEHREKLRQVRPFSSLYQPRCTY
jgi:protein regulator of cytokinesis 1